MRDFSNDSGSGMGQEVRASALKVSPATRSFVARLTVRGQHHKWEHSHIAPLSQ